MRRNVILSAICAVMLACQVGCGCISWNASIGKAGTVMVPAITQHSAPDVAVTPLASTAAPMMKRADVQTGPIFYAIPSAPHAVKSEKAADCPD